MPRINLLPWRAALRQQRKKEFVVALVGAAVVGLGIAYLTKLTVDGWISNQRSRNAILSNEIGELDKQIEEIKGLENQRERLIARMKVIGELQRARPEVVHLFDELVKAVPEGVHLTEVKQIGTRIELQGVAQSSTRVSTLMRNIESSPWLGNPQLVEVQLVPAPNAAAGGGAKLSQFTLNLNVKRVTPPGVADPATPAKGKA